MASWDTPSVATPGGASYAAPLLDFTQLSKIPEQVFQGQQRARTRDLQTAFKDGLPKNADGTLDIGQMSDTLAKLGGADAAMPLMQLQIQQQLGKGNADAVGNAATSVNGSQPLPNASPTSPQAQPAPIPPHGIPSSAPTSAPSGQPGEASNPQTLANVVQEQIQDPTIAGRVITAASKRLGIDPGQPIDPNNPTLKAYIKSAGGGVIPNGGTASNPPGPTEQQPQFAQAAPAAPTPAGMDLGTANRLDQAAERLRARAASIAKFDQQGAMSLDKQADDYSGRAKQIREFVGKNAEQTTEQKNLYSGAAAKNEEQKLEIAQSQKTYNGIQASATQFQRTLKPAIDMAKGILNRPEMYSGIGGDISLDFNKVKAALGSPQAAALQEGLQKINAISVLSQVNQQRDELQEAGGASARIFSQQVDQVAKASASLQNTVYGNRFLVNFQERMGNLSTEIAQQARDYITKHGHLDHGFDQQISNHIKKNPVFTEQEKSDPRILGAPDAPGNIRDKNGVLAWAGQMGLKSGDPFKTPDGKIRYIP